MAAKTPVSILQEMMTRMGTPPKYDLIYDGSGTHTAVFKYRVYANDVSAIGTGRSKKEAKHEAARIALERLSLHQIEYSQPTGIPPEPIEIMTPYKDKLTENAIGALHDMCSTNEIPMPDYKLIEEKGAPHDKIFTFVCSVSKQKEIGIGRTKKQAKQLAAYNMMNRLKMSLGDVLKDLQEDQYTPEPVGENFERSVAKYVAAVGTPRKKFRLNRSPNKYHFINETPQDCQEAAWNILCEIYIPESIREIKDMDCDWMLHLNRVLECLDVQKSFVRGKQLSNGLKSIFLQVNLATEAVFFGVGKDDDEAMQQAAYNGLVFLNILLRRGGRKT